MEVPPRYRIFQTEHWLLNHRIDSALPGYLMLCSVNFVDEFSQLSDDALTSLGPLLAKAQNEMKQLLKPNRIYTGRYGHSPCYPVHFHLIPIYDWVEELFSQDTRYRLLEKFVESSAPTGTDGAELTLFVWREFCEKPVPPKIKGPSVFQTIDLLREGLSLRSFEPHQD